MGSCKTYGKLLLQQAPPPQHAHDLHSEDNLHLVQGLLHIRVNLATKDIPRLALSKKKREHTSEQPATGAIGVAGRHESSAVHVEELVPRNPAVPYFRP